MTVIKFNNNKMQNLLVNPSCCQAN